MANRVRIVKASTAKKLEDDVNVALAELGDAVVDIKVAGAFDGDNERYVVVIVYKA